MFILSMEFDDLDTARSWVVLVACFVTMLVNGGTNYTVGLIHMVLLDRFLRGNAVTSWAGSIYSALYSLASPLSSVLVDKASCRVAIVTSGVLCTMGYIGTAFAPTLEVAILTCSIAGLGGASCYAACIVAQGFYFRRFRNFAQGFALSGIGVGMFVLSPVMQASKATYGDSGFFLVLGSISMQVIVCGTLVKPSKLEKYTQFKRKCGNTVEKEIKRISSCRLLKTYWTVLTTKSIFLLSVGLFLFQSGTYIIFMNIPTYSVYKGFSDIEASFLLSACGISSIVCRLLTGVAANSGIIDEIILYSCSMGILSLFTCLFPLFSKFYSGHIVYAVILGIYFGNPYVLINTINIQYVGISKTATAIGIELFFGGLGALAGPVITGLLLDGEATYEQVFILGGLTILVAALCSLASAVFASGESDSNERANITDAEMEVVVADEKHTEELVSLKVNTHEICKDTG